MDFIKLAIEIDWIDWV